MPVLPLPNSPPIRLEREETWWEWEGLPRKQVWPEPVTFWESHPPLTIPQLLAIRLARAPDRVSHSAVTLFYKRLAKRAKERHGGVERFRLVRYEGIWNRTHATTRFRFDPTRVKRALGPDSPLGRVARWATPDALLESRFLMAGLPEAWDWSRRREAVRGQLRMGERTGYVFDVAESRVPACVWRPSRAWARAQDIVQPRIKESAVDHGALAIEAALMRQRWRGEVGAITAIRSEADVVAAARKSLGRGLSAGDRLDATPDLEIEVGGGMRYMTEVLSTDYRNDDVAAKYAGVSAAVEFVATSRTVAARAATVMPAVAVYYF